MTSFASHQCQNPIGCVFSPQAYLGSELYLNLFRKNWWKISIVRAATDLAAARESASALSIRNNGTDNNLGLWRESCFRLSTSACGSTQVLISHGKGDFNDNN